MTESEDQEVDFHEADRRYAEIKQRHEAGNLTDEEFDEQLKELMVQDQEDRWWVKSRNTGEWHYYDGTAWIKDTPPGYEPPQGGQSITPARASTSPRTILLRWLVPVAFVGLVVIVVAIARNPGGDSDHAGGGGGSASNPTPSSSDLPFSDDFSNTSSGWPQVREKDHGHHYYDGGYRVYEQESGGRAVSRLVAGSYRDVAVEVDAKMLSSQTDGIASGVVCRRQNPNNYYSMMVFPSGFVSISKIKDANIRRIENDYLSEETGGNVYSPRVHIRGVCVGDTLTLYVEDQKVLEAEDSEFRTGDVGLFAFSAGSTAGTDILFDNFSVTKP